MSIVLQSTGGGQITIQEPATASNFTQTLPAAGGTILTTTAPKAGNVIQVVSTTSNTQFSTASPTNVSTGFTLSITPTSSSSKILVMANAGVWAEQTAAQPIYTLVRNSINLGSSARGFGQYYSSAGALQGQMAMQFLDSPATTSSTTYAVFMRVVGGTGYWGADGGTQVLTLMEIAA